MAGRYKLLQHVGEGGMGTVWMADQTEPVRRRVAVKLIRVDRGQSKIILARFEAERQAIALMDHPNIAKLFDAGTTEDGSPYFVMELVSGTPLVQYCDEHRLGISDRLKLFVEICSAVQHAHQKGIIHRDLKPSNILVENHDHRAVPRVIDFGLAKATTGMQLTEHTLFTAFGSALGTPLYMAPEQATFNAVDVDTRADVYSLGVILYELLTGSTPITRDSMKKAAVDEMLKLIREQEAPTPSSRLSTDESRPAVAASRGMEPEKLGRFVKGELDWIVLKALSKERDRRYDTAIGFGRDVERFLNSEPVVAGPPTAGYRVRKFVQRNRMQVIAAGLVLAALVLGVVGTTAGLLWAEKRRVEAVDAQAEEYRQRLRADAFKNKVLETLRATTEKGVELLIAKRRVLGPNERRYLEAIAERWRRFTIEIDDSAESRSLHGEGCYRVACLWMALGRRAEAMEQLNRSVEIRNSLNRDFPDEPHYKQDLHVLHDLLGRLFKEVGDHRRASEEFGASIRFCNELIQRDPEAALNQECLAGVLTNQADALSRLGRPDEARKSLEKSRSILLALAARAPEKIEYQEKLLLVRSGIADHISRFGALEESLAEYEGALRDVQRIPERDRAREELVRGMAAAAHNMAIVLADLKQLARAEAAQQTSLRGFKILADAFPHVVEDETIEATGHGNLGRILGMKGELEKGRAEYRKSIEMFPTLATQFPDDAGFKYDLAMQRNGLGALHANARDFRAARAEFEKAAGMQRNLVEKHPADLEYKSELATSLENLAQVRFDSEDAAGAVESCRECLAIRLSLVERSPESSHYRRRVASARRLLGRMLGLLREREEAKRQFQLAKDELTKLSSRHPSVAAYLQELADAQNSLGLALSDLGEPAAARAEYDQSMQTRRLLVERFPDNLDFKADLAGSCSNLGNWFAGSGRVDESIRWYNDAILLLQTMSRPGNPSRKPREYLRNTLVARAKAYGILGNDAEASRDWSEAVKYCLETERQTLRALRVNWWIEHGRVDEALPEIDELTRRPPWPADQWYNFSCGYAIAAGKSRGNKRGPYADRAMELLRRAVEQGYQDVPHMKTDADLNPLRDRSDFKKLVADQEAKVRSSGSALKQKKGD